MEDNIVIKPLDETDREWLLEKTKLLWESTTIISRGKEYNVGELPGFIALQDKERAGFIVTNAVGDQLEIVGLLTVIQEKGIGSRLVQQVINEAKEMNTQRVWLITTNDNIPSLRFYQKRGFVLTKLYKNALEVSRKIKPEIPLTGMYGIPLRDELELELIID